ncbi:MAG: hypothetical protein ACXQTP_01575 [Candidatus Methanofastidiosia archaeon]
MVNNVQCNYCGKEMAQESEDIEMPSYVIDDERKIVCLGCYHYRENVRKPIITTYPKEKSFWMDGVFSGFPDFNARWIKDDRYRGHWDVLSRCYKKILSVDSEAQVRELKEKGESFVIVEVNGKREIWKKE